MPTSFISFIHKTDMHGQFKPFHFQSRLESKLCKLYKNMVCLKEMLTVEPSSQPASLISEHISQPIRDRLASHVTTVTDMLRDCSEDLLSLSVLYPAAPWVRSSWVTITSYTCTFNSWHARVLITYFSSVGQRWNCSLLGLKNATNGILTDNNEGLIIDCGPPIIPTYWNAWTEVQFLWPQWQIVSQNFMSAFSFFHLPHPWGYYKYNFCS